jgi:hypothetical protein
MNPGRGDRIVSFGFILQVPNNDPVIAIRGTDGIREWIHDFEFLATKCPFLPGGQAKRMMASPQDTTLSALRMPPLG